MGKVLLCIEVFSIVDKKNNNIQPDCIGPRGVIVCSKAHWTLWETAVSRIRSQCLELILPCVTVVVTCCIWLKLLISLHPSPLRIPKRKSKKLQNTRTRLSGFIYWFPPFLIYVVAAFLYPKRCSAFWGFVWGFFCLSPTSIARKFGNYTEAVQPPLAEWQGTGSDSFPRKPNRARIVCTQHVETIGRKGEDSGKVGWIPGWWQQAETPWKSKVPGSPIEVLQQQPHFSHSWLIPFPPYSQYLFVGACCDVASKWLLLLESILQVYGTGENLSWEMLLVRGCCSSDQVLLQTSVGCAAALTRETVSCFEGMKKSPVKAA